jgi:hypothetical protein
MLPELLDQISPDPEIGSVTADGAFDTASAMTPSLPAPLLRSSYPARTPSPGSPTPPARLPATKPYAPRAASVEPSGDDGAVTTAEAASRYEPGQKTIRGIVFPANGCTV